MMHVGNFVGMLNLFHGHVKIFVAMSMNKLVGMEKFCGYGRIFKGMKFWLWKIFFGYVMLDHGKFCSYDFGYVGIYLCMDVDMWEFFFFFFFNGYLDHVGIFS